MPTLKPSTLELFAAQLLQAGGTSSDEAKLVAASLVDAGQFARWGGARRAAGRQGAAPFDESVSDWRAARGRAAGARFLDQHDGRRKSPREKNRRTSVSRGLADRQRRPANDRSQHA